MKLVDGPPWLKDSADMLVCAGPRWCWSSLLCSYLSAVLICHCMQVIMAEGKEERRRRGGRRRGRRQRPTGLASRPFVHIYQYLYRIPAHPAWMEAQPNSSRAAMSAHIRYTCSRRRRRRRGTAMTTTMQQQQQPPCKRPAQPSSPTSTRCVASHPPQSPTSGRETHSPCRPRRHHPPPPKAAMSSEATRLSESRWKTSGSSSTSCAR